MAEKTPSGSNCFFAAQRRAPLVPYAEAEKWLFNAISQGLLQPRDS
jgi:hypothetical protein